MVTVYFNTDKVGASETFTDANYFLVGNYDSTSRAEGALYVMKDGKEVAVFSKNNWVYASTVDYEKEEKEKEE